MTLEKSEVEEAERREFVEDFQGFEDEKTEEELEEEARLIWEDKLQIFGNGVEAEAEEFERIRKPVENRMLRDTRQYQGADDTITKLNPDGADEGASRINVNITRKKTNAAEARLSDMLFPTDDKNWGLEPSPVPKLAIKGMPESAPGQQPAPPPEPAAVPEQPMGQAQQPGQPEQMGQPGEEQAPEGMKQLSTEQALNPGAQPAAEPVPELTEAEIAEKEAKARCELMVDEMTDQLSECNYAAQGREAIRSGCKLGTGVIKGPILLGKSRRAWVKKTDNKGNSAYVQEDVPDNSPGFEFVSAWDFFPDMSATKIQDCEIIFQRHWMTRRDLIRLAKRDDFMTDQVRKVLRKTPDKTPPDYLTQLRSMSDITTAVGDEKRYVVWERHGPIDPVDLQACGVIDKDAEIDPLDEYQGIVWVCQGVVIKAAVNPMETEDQLFSVFCFEEDDACIFGFGVPYLIRDAQKVVRNTWRMIMDNAGLSVGGQIIINKSSIEPAPLEDGTISWDITPLKPWFLKNRNAKAQDAFHIFEFPNHQNELAANFNMAMQLADEESGIPPVAEGESGAQQTTTAHGMEMLMNNHNIVMRRGVKNWDDNMTIPNITRLYDHNMQNHPNNDIKGDFSPKAKGSSALLQKETQSRNMLNLVNFLMTPTFAGWVKDKAVVEKLVTSMQHDPDELIKTQAEYDAWAKQQQEAAGQQQGNNSVEVQKMKNDFAYKVHQEKMQDKAADRKFQALLADKENEREMIKLAQVKDLSLAKISADLTNIHEKSKADRTLMADEFKVKLKTGSGL